jgi:hypothetical protein
MLREAELFVMAEQMLVEVLGRIRPADRDTVLPAMFDAPGGDRPAPMRQAVEQYAADDASVPAVLAGVVDADPVEGDVLGGDWRASVPSVAGAAIAAARQVTDGDAVMHPRTGDVPARLYLLRLTIARSLLAHYVATYLGSTACPLPEELARPLWELTSPTAETWRSRGFFRDPLPLPENVSWRDRFLLSAGHEPHPLGH